MTFRQGVIARSDPAFNGRPEAPYVELAQRTVESASVRKSPSTRARPVLDKVLIASDFSKHAGHAMDRVAMLADQRLVSRSSLLHVVRQSPIARIQSVLQRSSMNELEHVSSAQQLAAVADKFRIRTGLTVDEHVEHGSLAKAVHRYASDADLVMLGAPGARPLRDFAIGSTASRVLRGTRKPVLVVRRRADVPYRRVLVAVDFALDAGNALAYAQAIAPEARLNLVHVYRVRHEEQMLSAGVAEDVIHQDRREAQVEAAGKMIELIRSHPPSAAPRVLLVHGYAAAELLEKGRDLMADLIVVTKREECLGNAFLLDSVTQQLLEKSRSDVLVVRAS
jgi:nucleotide-binding universal stress UspA family protein